MPQPKFNFNGHHSEKKTFLMLFVCIGSVSALENQTDDIGENIVIKTGESPEILTSDEYTYTDLRNKIGTGVNVTLDCGTYTYGDGDGDTIKIETSNIIIDGNGEVIDMASSGIRAFEITKTSKSTDSP